MSDLLPWERPLGSRVLDDERAEFRVWAPIALPTRSHCARRREGRSSSAEAGHDVHEKVTDGPAAAMTTGTPSIGGAAPARPVLALAARRPARPVADPVRAPATQDSEPPYGRRQPAELLIYELHIGTFSSEGTFDGAIAHLPELAELGVTAIELMPVAEFPGARGWGYDGVYLSAAQSSYGGPEQFAQFVASAHRSGLAVILDVVYNHLGASGAQAMEAFGPYFTGKYQTPWGKAINYDDADCDAVREWVGQSAEGWVRDFGIDGLRLDAIHAIFDASPEHIVAAWSPSARARHRRPRGVRDRRVRASTTRS